MQNPYFIDTHSHIYYHEKKELTGHIQRCKDNNIQKVLMPNVDVKSIAQIERTMQAFPEVCIPMMGLHPCSVKENYKEQLAEIKEQIQKLNICAIGEIGLDLHWDTTTLDWQKDAFETQIDWAIERNLPIDIHCRKAFDEIFEILERVKKERPSLHGVFHCFTGDLQQAQRAIDLGFLLGIGGIVTYKNAGLDKVVANIDLEHLLLETDAPYLSPVPHRGKPNESSYLIHTAQKVAELKQVSWEDIAQKTTENAIKIFKLKE